MLFTTILISNYMRIKSKLELQKARADLWAKKDITYIPEAAQFPCPDSTHPLFTINASETKPGVCYYCSKVYIVKR